MFGTSQAGIFLFFKYSRKFSITRAKCASCPSLYFSGIITFHLELVIFLIQLRGILFGFS